MIFLQLFITFFQIGLFGFGGGYGMISLIQNQVVTQYGWLTMGEFADIIAVSQMTPGPIGINSATYCGYTAVHNAGMGVPLSILGSVVATFALVLPSLILMTIIAKMFLKHMNNSDVQNVFSMIKPTVVGLLAAATLMLMNKETFSTPTENAWQFYISTLIFITTFVGTKFFKVNPIKMTLMSAFAGLLLLY